MAMERFRPEIGVADSLRPMALDPVRTKREAPTVRDVRRRSPAWSVLWFFGAAVFSFSTMAILERRGLSQLLMPPRPPPAEVIAANDAPIAFTATRQTRTFEDALTSPWRHRERGENKVPATSPSTATPPTVASSKRDAKPPTARVAAQPATAGATAPASSHDEVAAAAAILEKARGEHSLE